MNKITSERSLEDNSLVSFLQTYSPPPPLEKKPCEELVMRSIAQDKEYSSPTKKINQGKLFLLLPITLISSLVMVSGHLLKQKLSPQIASELEDMDTFIVNTWQGSMGQEWESEDSLYMAGSAEY